MPSAPIATWQHELEASFPYVETQDQLDAIEQRQGGHGAARSRWTA